MAEPNAETTTATAPAPTGPAPGQAAAPNGTASAAPPAPSLQDQLAESRRLLSEANARAENTTRGYQGLQRTLAQTQRELAQAKENERLLSLIPGLVEAQQQLATAQLGPEAARALGLQMENAALKNREAARQAQPAPVPDETPAGYAPRPPSKAEVLQRFYPGIELSPDDPLIDYAGDAMSQEDALRRFHSSVARAITTRAGEKASQATRTAVDESTREVLVRAGVETTDGHLPAGPLKAQPASDDPSKWNPRQLLTAGFQASGDPHEKLLERQAARGGRKEATTAGGANVAPEVRTR